MGVYFCDNKEKRLSYQPFAQERDRTRGLLLWHATKFLVLKKYKLRLNNASAKICMQVLFTFLS